MKYFVSAGFSWPEARVQALRGTLLEGLTSSSRSLTKLPEVRLLGMVSS